MDSVHIIFAAVLASIIVLVQTTKVDGRTTNESLQIPTPSPVNISEHVIVPLEDMIFTLDPNTIVQFTNLQLSIPSDLHLGENDPDFSKMVLRINAMIGSLEVKGDYVIFTYGYAMLPISSQGSIHLRLDNVTATGETALALTPAALLALSYNFAYKPESVKFDVVPLYKNGLTQEELLSNVVFKESIVTVIKKKIDNNLNYYSESYINMILSKISVFTVGHKKEESFVKEPFSQNIQIGDLFDELLVDVTRVLKENGKDEMTISSFHRNFSEKVDSTVVSGNFSAVDGWVSGISSVKRFSNVSLSKKENVFILSAGVDFNLLEMGYDKYKAIFTDTQVSGEIDGTFLQTKMMMQVSMNPKPDGTCQSVLSELRSFKMNGYRIKTITNIGSHDWLQRRINNWLIGYFQVKIVKEIEKELGDAIHKSLNRFDCGDYLPHLKVLG